jgi:hypothetical protein
MFLAARSGHPQAAARPEGQERLQHQGPLMTLQRSQTGLQL